MFILNMYSFFFLILVIKMIQVNDSYPVIQSVFTFPIKIINGSQFHFRFLVSYKFTLFLSTSNGSAFLRGTKKVRSLQQERQPIRAQFLEVWSLHMAFIVIDMHRLILWCVYTCRHRDRYRDTEPCGNLSVLSV